MIELQINGVNTKGLWDTGSMVSMLDTRWFEENVATAETPVMTVQEFLEGDTLNLLAANNTPVTIDGIVVLLLVVGTQELQVPFILSKSVTEPIIGYNVIEHVCNSRNSVEGLALCRKINQIGAS